jgi:hypothetical protein
MSIIINIQIMQEVVYGKRFEYSDFNGNSVDELRNLQSSLIPEYNSKIAERNKDIS